MEATLILEYIPTLEGCTPIAKVHWVSNGDGEIKEILLEIATRRNIRDIDELHSTIDMVIAEQEYDTVEKYISNEDIGGI